MLRFFAVLLATTLLETSALAHAQTELVFGTTHDAHSASFHYARDYLQQLCAENKLNCALRSLPGRRSEALLAIGKLDGEIGRVKGYGLKHPDYVRVEEPFNVVQTRIFTRTPFTISSWQSLTYFARTVSYKRGIFLYQQRLEQLVPSLQLHDVQSEDACLQVVLAQRSEACVFDVGGLTGDARRLLKQGYTSASIEDLPLYLYLHKDRGELALPLAETARRMQARGVPAQLRRTYYELK
ncbi:hypothetical protein ACFFKC_14325 [Pseudoduganella danionis]|uniref:Transporter substrate-binding domain-containing protein n=1 Tax=Pseudoduganella danionis TaxID=1890295 RepID=A0ABW9SM57_9BURK|nr:hypothetical protein [Pseudoduganella danionis]MTW33070.1 hypothetical protein [Pseudoduganella danionis]